MENGKLREEVEGVFESWKKIDGNCMNPGIYLYLAKLTCSWQILLCKRRKEEENKGGIGSWREEEKRGYVD